ncbi:MAG: hypothetical protein V2B19_00065 [Pseudomonadota bacterium]
MFGLSGNVEIDPGDGKAQRRVDEYRNGAIGIEAGAVRIGAGSEVIG